ncbi:MAG TPA: flagellar basal body rod protein FlgC [Pirellulaceae bacterium]|mgnify:CR=1 FL=1|nr:flagellar basal body rod protein FlgC [Pirellulaceae bacterium]HMO92878.1 flagellar basal body rod protein FlgC [Pirellulaceae bacterium]HMP71089.1 flagellar basal body rod protein FlgC [Pirellulaceae bacterium]
MHTAAFSGASISAKGMSAERQRMEVVANNIANAHSTRSHDGGPYRRQQLVFAASLDGAHGNDFIKGLGGVDVVAQINDPTEFPMIYNPGHPDADPETGLLAMPNVKLPNEMVDLITASRTYEANLKALTSFKQMVELTLRLLRGGAQ